MGLSSLIKVIYILTGITITLFVFSIGREFLARSDRARESTFIALTGHDTLEVKDISRVDVELPHGELRWSYKRIDGLWRLPEFAGAFAFNGEVDNLVKTILQSRARPVGRLPEDEARYGLTSGSTLMLTLFKDSAEVVQLQVGGLRPGATKDERYVRRGKDDEAYLLNSNPAVFFEDKEAPAMLDRHVLPRALPHGMPARIVWKGTKEMELKELAIKALPVDPKKESFDPSQEKKGVQKREPTHEFTGTYVSGAKKILDESEGMTFVNKILNLEFDKIVGSISPVQVEYQKFDAPLVEVTLQYDTASPISLAVSGTLIEGRYPILNRASGQMFIISNEKVDDLIPAIRAK
jgi:hypothetical protein